MLEENISAGSSQSQSNLLPESQEIPTVKQLMEQNHPPWSSISFGCRALDQLLNGGLPRRGISELFGESASGKSQICMQLAVTAQLPPDRGGTGKGVVYFTTTAGRFPTERLFAIIQAVQERYPDVKREFMSNIFIQSRIEINGLLHCIQNEFQDFLKTHQIGLVIVDSMGIFRSERETSARAKFIRSFAISLLQLAEKHGFSVLCVNEVVSIPGHSNVFPSLGLAWANLVVTRLQVARTERTTQTGDIVRTVSVMQTPEISLDSAEFIVTSKGIYDIST
ncbi:DNA repair protein XRCC3 [Phlebotomus argentipes]|uniref:DNA repair protein XRCC3 n=1 Tax=Phlebotomus argentipes TaxID=94469 RepID=UPI0028936078|nr:DNA repair protein XRCC3 [Phlebotomus argentipes]